MLSPRASVALRSSAHETRPVSGTSSEDENGSSRLRRASGAGTYNPFILARILRRTREGRTARTETSCSHFAVVCSTESGARRGYKSGSGGRSRLRTSI